MKTPREFLLERHHSAEAKLEAICAEDLAACARAASPGCRRPKFPANLEFLVTRLWRESLWPWRRIWCGLAAIWLVLLALNLGTREGPEMARRNTPQPSSEWLAALREERQLRLRWSETEPSTPPVRLNMPRPRSERRPVIMYCSGRDERPTRTVAAHGQTIVIG